MQLMEATVHPKLGYERCTQMRNGTWCEITSSMGVGSSGQVCLMSPAVCFHPQGVVTVGHLSMHPTLPINITGIIEDAEEWMKTINHTGMLMALAHINAAYGRSLKSSDS
ncbi:UNVERIFIED_CONTAM: hypothetical protein FKN15_034070 [Acipenser sinensis]